MTTSSRRWSRQRQATTPRGGARRTFVVADAGYTGTEAAAQGQLVMRAAPRRYHRVRHDELRWLLVDRAPAVLPEPGQRLGGPALRILRHCGLDVRLETVGEEVTGTWVRLSDGTTVPTSSLTNSLPFLVTGTSSRRATPPRCLISPKAGRLADDRPVCAAEGSAVARNVAAP